MNLYVANLAPTVQPGDLMRLFNGVGHVMYARLAGKSALSDRGYAFVHIPDEDSARRTAAALHGTLLNGEPLAVHPMSEGAGHVRALNQ